MTAERAPEAPVGAGVGGHGGRAPSTSSDHPCGARSGRCPSLSLPRANAASWPIRARFVSFYCKVSQNREVSPKFDEKACHSPYIQNGSQMSPLEFLRFPFSRAFSHKELMGLFCTHGQVYCQNDEVSPKCTPDVTRSVRQIPPHGHAASRSCDRAPHLARRGILNALGFRRFLGDYD